MFDLSIEKQKEYAISWLLSEGKILNNKEQETLTIYIHILAQYLSDSAADFKLNDLVLI